MSTIPNKVADKIAFCADHNAPFSANAVAIGTTSTAVTDLQTKTAAASTALAAQTAAQNAAKAATVTLKSAVTAMQAAMADIIKQIRTKAATTGDSVYALAQIDPPAPPSPVGPLGKPSDFVAELTETGVLELTWKNTNPRSAGGAVYQIWRQIGATGTMEYLGGTGTKAWTDNTLPAGSTNVVYQIQAVRSTSVGPFATFNVKFGVGDGTTTVTETTPVKIAA